MVGAKGLPSWTVRIVRVRRVPGGWGGKTTVMAQRRPWGGGGAGGAARGGGHGAAVSGEEGGKGVGRGGGGGQLQLPAGVGDAAAECVGVDEVGDAEILEGEGEAGGAGGGAWVGEAAESQGVRAEGDADGLAAARTGRAAGCAELEDGGTGGGGERGEDDIPALDGGGMPEQPGGEGGRLV